MAQNQGASVKEILASIGPFMSSRGTQALLEIPDFPGMSVSDCEDSVEKMIDRDLAPFLYRSASRYSSRMKLVEQIFNTLMLPANIH
jgi:nitrogen regulatory protein P-II 1